MKILLLGDYSNVHATLACGLRELGHDVVVASDGDAWKGYPRDVDLRRPSLRTLPSLAYYLRLLRTFRRFRGYDVVQLINPVFLPLRAEHLWPFYRYLRRNNGKVFLGAFGMDHYYVKTCLDCRTFRYSDFNLGANVRHSVENDVWISDWLLGAKGKLNRFIAEDADGIVAGLYEYFVSYRTYFPAKLRYIPFPIRLPERTHRPDGRRVRFFIGIQRTRSAYKGTDVMLRALERVKAAYPDRCDVVRVESVPFSEYVRLLRGSDVLLDQLYSYTPAMNALEAMARGMVVVSGGEPEAYDLLGETSLRPIVNVQPDEADVFRRLVRLVEHPEELPRLSRESREYVARHHDYLNVARQYLAFWNSLPRRDEPLSSANSSRP